MSVQPPESLRLSRRTLFVAGSVGMGAMIARPVLAQSAGAERPPEIDIGRVENGKVTFPEWKGPNDAPSSPPPAPQPDEQRVGFAIVGLGRLSLEQLLPAFGETMRAKVVALVSGTPEKAQAVARQYGVSADAIYGYDD
ncbi:Gfo/Idh/MocA family oxidoreductase [Brevundimonas sp. PAMC22021]|uniref:Gfo/Idh/MocA family oxidoreductase n=1 Tax=Brevundimonas sp. PAMC22021 TaxID=2861285 RepID=UPI001C627375|nr:Gfo/Idh/MocA family oxidoreductase [Brevundimonas sp. PAMC22021]QYF86125.1 Gfo/Idh/MocA family oxidoreductase [Brevundimonas sp. PAMC22021]